MKRVLLVTTTLIALVAFASLSAPAFAETADPHCDQYGNQAGVFEFEIDTPNDHREHAVSNMTASAYVCGTDLNDDDTLYNHADVEVPPGVEIADSDDVSIGSYAGSANVNVVACSSIIGCGFYPSQASDVRTANKQECYDQRSDEVVGQTPRGTIVACLHGQGSLGGNWSWTTRDDAGKLWLTIGPVDGGMFVQRAGITYVGMELCGYFGSTSGTNCPSNGQFQIKNGDASAPSCNGGHGPEGVFKLTATMYNGTRPTDQDCVVWTPENQPPECSNMPPPQLNVESGSSITFNLSCTDPEGDTLFFDIVSQSSHGQVTLLNSTTGEVRYTNNGDGATSDSFTFRAKDPQGSNTWSLPTRTATIAVDEGPENHEPTCEDVESTGSPGEEQRFRLPCDDIDSDDNPGNLTYSIVRDLLPPDAGTVELDEDTGWVIFTPSPGFVGTADFTFKACDDGIPIPPSMCSSPPYETATITVPTGESSPGCRDIDVYVDENEPALIQLECEDDDPPPLTYKIEDEPENGEIIDFNPSNGRVVYRSNPGVEQDSLTYKACDNNVPSLCSDMATVHITVGMPHHFTDRECDGDPYDNSHRIHDFKVTTPNSDAASMTSNVIAKALICGTDLGSDGAGNYGDPDHTTDPNNSMYGSVNIIVANGEIFHDTWNWIGAEGAPMPEIPVGSYVGEATVNVLANVCNDPCGDEDYKYTPHRYENQKVELTVDAPGQGWGSCPADSISGVRACYKGVFTGGPDPSDPNDDFSGEFWIWATVTSGYRYALTMGPINAPEGIHGGVSRFELSLCGYFGAVESGECGSSGSGQIVRTNGDESYPDCENGNGMYFIWATTRGGDGRPPDPVSTPPENTCIEWHRDWNMQPNCNDKDVETEWETPVTIQLDCSDNNPDDTINYEIVEGYEPNFGTLSGLDPDTGEVTYTPNDNFAGQDRFAYKACDDREPFLCSFNLDDNNPNNDTPAFVNITVGPTPPPDCQNINMDVLFETPTIVQLDCASPGGYFFTCSIDDTYPGPFNGSIVNNNPYICQALYEPNDDFTGTDRFAYVGTDEFASVSDSALVTLNVQQPPECNDMDVDVPYETESTFTLSCPDPNGDDVRYVKVEGSGPRYGTITNFNELTGEVTYEPDPLFFGDDSFRYKACKDDYPDVCSNEKTVNLTVVPPPKSTCEDVEVNVPFLTETSVQLSCSDPGGNDIQYEIVPNSGPNHGRLGEIDQGTGEVPYTPYAYFGEDSFRYTACRVDNSNVCSDEATAELNVEPPTATDPACDQYDNEFSTFEFEVDTPDSDLEHAVSKVTASGYVCGSYLSGSGDPGNWEGDETLINHAVIAVPPGVEIKNTDPAVSGVPLGSYAGKAMVNILVRMGDDGIPYFFDRNGAGVPSSVVTEDKDECIRERADELVGDPPPGEIVSCLKGSNEMGENWSWITRDASTGNPQLTIGPMHGYGGLNPSITHVNTTLCGYFGDTEPVDPTGSMRCGTKKRQFFVKNGDASVGKSKNPSPTPTRPCVTPLASFYNTTRTTLPPTNGVYTLTATNEAGETTAPTTSCVLWYPNPGVEPCGRESISKGCALFKKRGAKSRR